MTSALSFLNMPILQYADEIRSAVMLVHGEKRIPAISAKTYIKC